MVYEPSLTPDVQRLRFQSSLVWSGFSTLTISGLILWSPALLSDTDEAPTSLTDTYLRVG